MFGILLAGFSSALMELSDSIGKKKVGDDTASHYTYGFLWLLFGTVFLITIGLIRDNLIFSFASLPTFIPRVLLEILQAHITILAVVKADRSDFGILRIFTIPLLLGIDIFLGYSISLQQILAMGMILSAVIVLLSWEKFQTKGLGFLLFISINAAITLSLYKYDITHFNSVEAEQSIILLVLLLYFFILATVIKKENPLRFLATRAFSVQASASGLSSVASSFAYVFAPASVITSALRASAVLFSIISGRMYFKEKHILIKLGVFIGIIAGLLLLI